MARWCPMRMPYSFILTYFLCAYRTPRLNENDEILRTGWINQHCQPFNRHILLRKNGNKSSRWELAIRQYHLPWFIVLNLFYFRRRRRWWWFCLLNYCRVLRKWWWSKNQCFQTDEHTRFIFTRTGPTHHHHLHLAYENIHIIPVSYNFNDEHT